jgi:hypothetical protein
LVSGPGARIRLAVSLGMRESFEDGHALGRDLIAREPLRLPFTGNRIYGAKETPPSGSPYRPLVWLARTMPTARRRGLAS